MLSVCPLISTRIFGRALSTRAASSKTGYDSGAIDYILKPFAPDYLLNRLEEILTSESLTSDY